MGVYKVLNDELLKDKKFVGVARDDGYVVLHTYKEKLVLLKTEVEQVEIN
jgi:hypothetical protein